ncbi:hypothetical protein AB4Y38_32510 [Paraburkholderia sp. EG285A]|uniref:hypothetical protein n=1 Tax=Paraburkholderia sp. EG285A TaxID=3237009 RepID=UPI0034D21482
MDERAIVRLVPDDTYIVALDRDIWLMDDHRWALGADRLGAISPRARRGTVCARSRRLPLGCH